jgi:membrane protein DedA with SNARE-associated domain
MPAWMADWPVLGIYLFFLFGALARSQALFWLGRGVSAGALRTRWRERAESPQVRRATRVVERWGMPIVPAAFLTVGFQSAVFLAVGLLRVGWLRYTLWGLPGALVWAAVWGGSGLAALEGARRLAEQSPWLLVGVLLGIGVVVAAVSAWVRSRRETPADVAADQPAA